MRTNIVLDDELVKESFKYTKVKTKKDLVNLALKEFIQHHSRKNISDIAGKIDFFDYDYKKMQKSVKD